MSQQHHEHQWQTELISRVRAQNGALGRHAAFWYPCYVEAVDEASGRCQVRWLLTALDEQGRHLPEYSTLPAKDVICALRNDIEGRRLVRVRKPLHFCVLAGTLLTHERSSATGCLHVDCPPNWAPCKPDKPKCCSVLRRSRPT